MKRLKYFFIFTLLCLPCTSLLAEGTKSAIVENDTLSTNGEVVFLDKADFLSKIYNYETNTSEWVYEGSKPCIIDFYADWCGPCKRVAPILKELAKEYKDDIVIYKIDVDKEKDLAAAFNVTSIPMILFIPMEGMPQVANGAFPKEVFVEQIDQFLLGKTPTEGEIEVVETVEVEAID